VALVSGRRVLIVDEVSSTGETLRIVREKVAGLGAVEVRTAVLYAHTWGIDEPDYIALISDALLLNPWDREILRDGAFHVHPEYVTALAEQALSPDASFLIPATPFEVAKRRSE
jgi:hypoxanthine phosphoribosyltransferase